MCVIDETKISYLSNYTIYTHLTDLIYNFFCISITFDNAIKACFYNKKYTVSIKTRMTQIENCPEIEVNFLL